MQNRKDCQPPIAERVVLRAIGFRLVFQRVSLYGLKYHE
jgi:hypothetical protein